MYFFSSSFVNHHRHRRRRHRDRCSVVHINNLYVYVYLSSSSSLPIVWCVILSRFRRFVCMRDARYATAVFKTRCCSSSRSGNQCVEEKAARFLLRFVHIIFFSPPFGNTRVNDLLEISPPPPPPHADSHTRVSPRPPSRYLLLSTAREHVRRAIMR